MRDPRQLTWLRQIIAESGRGAENATPACLDDDLIAALAEGSLDDSARATALAHVAGCGRCLAAAASVAGALADAAVAREVAVAEGRPSRRFYRIALPAAAAAALLLLFLPRGTHDDRAVHRAPTITATAAPAPRFPVGVVSAPGSLRWAAVAGADGYRVTLFDASGRTLYEAVLADSVALLPDSVRLAPGRSYLWKVEARTGPERWASSDLVEFRVAGTPR